jgi:two-component system sensor histidine kinase/response regulator
MPGMDGFEVCKRLKDDDETAGIPIIFLTARTQTEDIVTGFKAGGVDYITKPFNTEELLSRVFTHLELKESRDTIKEQNQLLKELNATKDKFFRIIAHDLKSAFNQLLGFSSYCLKARIKA